jgi:activator of HSP90 ATPase
MNEKVTRRGLGLVLGGLAALPAAAQANKPGTTIHQEIDFNAPPERIYKILLDAKLFSAFTKGPAQIEPQAGAPFKLFGNRIEGRNVELEQNRRIVQAWRSASWAPGVYSIVKFELTARGAGTKIVFDHAGFTEDQWEHLNEGWRTNYWEPLRKYLSA